jgi:hypothetical protein
MPRLPATLPLFLFVLLLAGCGGGPSAPTPARPAATSEAVSRVGDVTVRANVVQTSALGEQVARGYGIERDAGTILLLVTVRQGDDADAVALPAKVTARATDLRGRRHDIAMRELRSGEFVDYIGTVRTDLPETLRFDVTVERPGDARSELQVTRDFQPQD